MKGCQSPVNNFTFLFKFNRYRHTAIAALLTKNFNESRNLNCCDIIPRKDFIFKSSKCSHILKCNQCKPTISIEAARANNPNR
jgi:hypothetical protein